MEDTKGKLKQNLLKAWIKGYMKASDPSQKDEYKGLINGIVAEMNPDDIESVYKELQLQYIYTDKKNTSNIGLNLKLGFKKVNIENKPNDHSQEFLKMEILKSDIRKINKALSID